MNLLPPAQVRGNAAVMDDERFLATGQRLVGALRRRCGLSPGSRILDMGCGAGRLALPLMECLGDAGSYEGFDVRQDAIAWCQENIASRRPSFAFRRVDLRNSLYNPRGSMEASAWRFPYEDGEFDLAVASSLFTHLARPARDHYLAELHRVLSPGGRFWLTFFLAEPRDEKFLRNNVAFHKHSAGMWVRDDASVEAAIAFTRGEVLGAMESLGFLPKRARTKSGQDVVYGVRP